MIHFCLSGDHINLRARLSHGGIGAERKQTFPGLPSHGWVGRTVKTADAWSEVPIVLQKGINDPVPWPSGWRLSREKLACKANIT